MANEGQKDQYKVEGYGVRTPGYDGPYHVSADHDPAFVYANAGDAKMQADYQNGLKALAGEEPKKVAKKTAKKTAKKA